MGSPGDRCGCPRGTWPDLGSLILVVVLEPDGTGQGTSSKKTVAITAAMITACQIWFLETAHQKCFLKTIF